jgi:hypothetical protein
MELYRFGSDPYDGVSANGWYILDGDDAVSGPFVDAGVAHRHKLEIIANKKVEA